MRDHAYKLRFMNHEVRGSGPVKGLKVVVMVLLGIVAVAVLAIILGVFVKLLWNALMPVIFGLPEVGYWQAVGLVVLAHVFFGANHASHRSRSSRKRKKDEDGDAEESSFHMEMEKDYAEFWREEGRDAFRSWMRRENGIGPVES